ncbi:hypothetical protein BCR34DRAFT_557810 [Clohesyomyces aquaticus]|uniref:Uncharacterized protein n=1 Tax=Clohesyomyces aquaticus TaxID=1231657 RepID=A0A1Y2A2C7_9PLEO|nr:hypothetical protein BCR34DRAFT_557810 [Clohesyomyces aquaticus]
MSALECSMRYDCLKLQSRDRKAPVFACMTCVDVIFCEHCYARHISGIGSNTESTEGPRDAKERRLIYVCSPKHEHVKVPPDGWRLNGDVVTIGGGDVSIKSWLEKLHI